MNWLNIAGLVTSVAGSFLFIREDWAERKHRSDTDTPIGKAKLVVDEKERELADREASLRATNMVLGYVDPYIEAALPPADREALAKARADKDAQVEKLTAGLRKELAEVKAKVKLLDKPDVSGLGGLPPDGHIRGFLLLLIGFLLQFCGEIFGP